jgi:hypothetical protein
MQPITQTVVKDTLLNMWVSGLLREIADPKLYNEWEENRNEWSRHEKVLFHSRLQQIRHEKENLQEA